MAPVKTAALLIACIFCSLFCDGQKLRYSKPTEHFIELLHRSGSEQSLSGIRHDGYYYEPVPDADHSINEPTIFLKNGYVFKINAVMPGNLMVRYKMNSSDLWHLYKSVVWGLYEIHGNTIDAWFYEEFKSGSVLFINNEYHITHYQGSIKDLNTIMHWGVIPPYPQIRKSAAHGYGVINTEFSFSELPEAQNVTTDRVWFNRFKTKTE